MNTNTQAPENNEMNQEPRETGTRDREPHPDTLREDEKDQEGQERDTRNPEKENVRVGKIDLEGGHHTNSPGHGEGDLTDTDEMDAVNRDREA